MRLIATVYKQCLHSDQYCVTVICSRYCRGCSTSNIYCCMFYPSPPQGAFSQRGSSTLGLHMVALATIHRLLCTDDTAVGTLRTGYPRVQASNQDNGSRLPAEGSSEAVTCPRGLGSRSQPGADPGPPRVPAARAHAPSSGQLRDRHVSLRLGLPLPARGSSGAVMCPRGSGSPSRLGVAPGPPRVPGALRATSK
jgi:hypothetical protein